MIQMGLLGLLFYLGTGFAGGFDTPLALAFFFLWFAFGLLGGLVVGFLVLRDYKKVKLKHDREKYKSSAARALPSKDDPEK
jgi:hypothetical protein